ncbi:RNA polymerase sigma factor [Metabacillus kandeliae]|uniref:RNA polymerase sigma factor n=1 Tax=Metabacillus kandeliae TaxID=2900151 RepID=UPI002F90C10A
MKKAQKGNDQAFLKIFQKYEEDLYRMAYVYVKNKEEALDIVQETAYQSFSNIHTLKQPENTKTWLIKITINCTMNLLKNKRKIVHLKKEYENIPSAENEFSLTLQEIINTLNEIEKSIVLLKHYQNYTFQEISDFLNISPGAAKSLCYRALDKLRLGFEEGDRCES